MAALCLHRGVEELVADRAERVHGAGGLWEFFNPAIALTAANIFAVRVKLCVFAQGPFFWFRFSRLVEEELAARARLRQKNNTNTPRGQSHSQRHIAREKIGMEVCSRDTHVTSDTTHRGAWVIRRAQNVYAEIQAGIYLAVP